MAQRLGEHKIFLVGAYREDAVSHSETIHSQTISEIQRRIGNRAIDLGAVSEDENKAFVDALLDRELNRYSAQFRQAFLQQTNGHPLFATELLEALKEEGALFQDAEGHWRDKSEIVWQQLPTRIEAVIGSRVGRLPEEVQQILTVASVEGETFTIQVIAQVMGYENRSLLKILEPASTQAPRIIQQAEAVQLNDSLLLQFRFSQTLFQQYLYQRIHPAEARLLHGEIAEALEGIFADANKAIEPFLGHHYEKAGLLSKAIHYYQATAETAVIQYANEDAIFYFTKVLALLPKEDLLTRADFLLARERINDLLGKREDQAKDLQALQQIVAQVPEKQLASVCLLREANHSFNLNEFAKAKELAHQVIEHNQANLELKLMAYQIVGRILLMRGQVNDAKVVFGKALECAEELTTIGAEATIFRNFGLVSSLQGELTMARSFLDKAQLLHNQAQSTLGEAKTLQSLSVVAHQNGNYSEALLFAERALAIFQTIGARGGEAEALQQIGAVNGSLGNWQRSVQYLQKAQEYFHKLGDHVGESMSLGYMSAAHYQNKKFQTAQTLCEKALQLQETIGLNWHKSWVFILLAKIAIKLNQWEAASRNIAEARQCWQSLSLSPANVLIQAVQLDLVYQMGDWETAKNLLSPVLAAVNGRLPNGAEDPFYIFVVCYKVLKAIDDQRAEQFIKQAYFQLEKIAQKITDQEAQKTFRKNIVSNQEIITYFKDVEVQ